MNLNQKIGGPDVKVGLVDQSGRSEQPIDLAQKVTLNPAIQIAGHSVAMHAQMPDGSKVPFTTLRTLPIGQRLAASSGSVPILPNSVSSQLTAKSRNLNFVRAVTDVSQSGVSRQVMTTAVYPVMSLGAGNVPMASIIRGAHALPPSIPSHPTATLYSSHVPRGPAAVATLSAGPKSVVATPMLRPNNSALHPRTATLVNRTVSPAISKTTTQQGALPQSVDPSKLGSGNVHPTTVQLGFTTERPFEQPRTTQGKPVHISQPIVQHIQQVPEKGYYKASTILTASQAHTLTQLSTVSTVSTSQHRSSPAACVVTIAPGSALRTTVSHHTAQQQQGNIISAHPLVVSGKTISHVLTPSSTHQIGLPTTHLKAADISALKKVAVSSSGNSIPVSALPRTIQASAIPTNSIPIAKVYPQPVTPPRSQTLNVISGPEGPRGNIYIAHPPQNIAPAASASSVTANANLTSTTVVLSDNRNDSGPLRFVPRTGGTGSTPYTVPPTAYFYESYPNTITMHPYTGTSGQSFPATTLSSTLRPVGLAVSEVVTHMGGAPSGLYTVSSGGSSVQSQAGSGSPLNQYGTNQSHHTNHNTSPRPSILRKRTSEGVSASVKKNLLASMPSSGPTSPLPPSPLQSSSTTVVTHKTHSETLKENGVPKVEEKVSAPKTAEPQESNDKIKKAVTTSSTPATNGLPLSSEASPRKKPRKQQLALNDLLESHSTDGEDLFEKKLKESREAILKQQRDKKDEENAAKWVTFSKRPTMSLLNSYHHTWKSRHNHFLKHADVKPKEEKKASVNELVNQKGVIKKINGWKIFHLTTQMEQMVQLEEGVHSQLSQLLAFMETTPTFKKTLSNEEEKIMGKVTDLIKGNLQRSKIVKDQETEIKTQMVKVVDHKQNIVNIVGKYVSKRPIKKTKQ